MSAAPGQFLSDTGGFRRITARWTIEADLILDSAAHFGGGSSGTTGTGGTADMVLIRDARTGGPLLPGTSIAGALRSHLADVFGGYHCRKEDARVARLFGASRGDDVRAQSPLIVFDSLGILPAAYGVEIRDGVKIDAESGTAEDHKKFDIEVLPAATTFPLRFDLLVPGIDGEAELVSLLAAALDGLASGDIGFGARRSRGLGMAHAVSWRAVRHDLGSRRGWIDWLLSDSQVSAARCDESARDARGACGAAAPDLELRHYADHRRRIVADVDLSLKGAMLVRSAPVSAGAPDTAHLQSSGRSVLPGSSLAGAMRNRALRVAAVVRRNHGDAGRWIDRLFGPNASDTDGAPSPALYASRLRIAEAFIENGTRARPARVRIDRFTQGVASSALFDEEIEQAGRVRVRMELREPQRGELGLLTLLLKDLLTGDVAVGGTSSVGRGVLEGEAALHLDDGKKVTLTPGQPDAPQIGQAIDEFWDESFSGGDP